jgi:putative membrane protein
MSVMCSPMGGVGWPLGLALMLGFWGLVAWAGVMLFRTFTGGHHHGAASLARRFAAGDIDEDEYRRRLAVLRNPDAPPMRERL